MFDMNLCPGVLACLDGYMNIALEQTEEYVNGQLKNKYGDAFIRGNNGKACDNIYKSLYSPALILYTLYHSTSFYTQFNMHLF